MRSIAESGFLDNCPDKLMGKPCVLVILAVCSITTLHNRHKFQAKQHVQVPCIEIHVMLMFDAFLNRKTLENSEKSIAVNDI